MCLLTHIIQTRKVTYIFAKIIVFYLSTYIITIPHLINLTYNHISYVMLNLADLNVIPHSGIQTLDSL